MDEYTLFYSIETAQILSKLFSKSKLCWDMCPFSVGALRILRATHENSGEVRLSKVRFGDP